jgi:isoprenylcysteine carboxyl methyltransferase (ICMT) family protein YpbQ
MKADYEQIDHSLTKEQILASKGVQQHGKSSINYIKIIGILTYTSIPIKYYTLSRGDTKGRKHLN